MQILITFYSWPYKDDVRQLNVIDLVCYGTNMDYAQTGYCTADIHKQLKFKNSIVFKFLSFSNIKTQAFMLKIEEKMSFYRNNDGKHIYYIIFIIMNLMYYLATSQNTTCNSPGM